MKRVYFLMLSLVMSTFTFAQSHPGFGLRAGLSSAGMRGDAVTNLQSLLDYTNGMVKTADRIGFYVGTYATLPLGESISLEPGVYYAQKGYDMTGELNIKGMEFLGANAKASLISHYIDVPLLLKMDMDGLQIFAGPQLSYLSKADLKTTAGVLGFNLLNKTMDASGQFNRWDAAVTAGLGYRFGNGVNIMAAYDYGLTKVDASRNMNSYNRALKIGIGIGF